jgi:DNA-binding response OmpR family regulator
VPFLKKVVIGEDEDAIAHLIQMALGDAGFLCLRGRNGEEALDLVRSEAPDLLILDVLMPKMDGIETVRRLKSDALLSRVPVLMLTALASIDDKVRGLEAGADDYLPKPFDLRELLARAQALVRQSRRERDRSPSTDLPGPGGLEDEIARRLGEAEPFALLFVEIEGFEAVLAEAGWRRGEELAAALGKRLAAAVAHNGLVAHLGGDDFAVVTAVAEAPALATALGALDGGEGRALVVTRVDAAGARSVDDVARAVAKARQKRTPV